MARDILIINPFTYSEENYIIRDRASKRANEAPNIKLTHFVLSSRS